MLGRPDGNASGDGQSDGLIAFNRDAQTFGSPGLGDHHRADAGDFNVVRAHIVRSRKRYGRVVFMRLQGGGEQAVPKDGFIRSDTAGEGQERFAVGELI